MHFMAIEVAAMKRLFLPSHPEISAEQILNHTPAVTRPFSYNHIHDLESLWWVAVWIVFKNYFLLSGDQLPSAIDDVEISLKNSQSLFPAVINHTGRQNGFQTSFMDACSGLPSNKQAICQCLNGLRINLIVQYKAMEDKNQSPPEADIYETFKTVLSQVKIPLNTMLVSISKARV